MKITVTIDVAHAKQVMRDRIPAILAARAEAIGAVVEGQAKERFRNSGDETGAWPDLWVNDPSKVARASGRKELIGDRALQVRLAERNIERVKARISAGTLKGEDAINAKSRAKRRLNLAKKISAKQAMSKEDAVFRAGGKPLWDTGILVSSITHYTTTTPNGATVEIGSPLAYGLYHQQGIDTKGPNYIPLTRRARKGWNPKLVPGYDYIVLQKVRVPKRVWMQFTDLNKRDIRETFAAVER